ncbi:hypothetical protein E2C01_002345 [Portunus trituberculatus]|uniref:Uncharacterized protein n=1 Tax=Portunus trituberculatus TaxID=210409 RepID=A0A5B7CN12_PORTR|nr:hypothetical protein [Portunus trituberculatus]
MNTKTVPNDLLPPLFSLRVHRNFRKPAACPNRAVAAPTHLLLDLHQGSYIRRRLAFTRSALCCWFGGK